MPERAIAIVGAGVAGAAAAIRLAELGVAVTLYEAVAAPQPIGAGLLLQPTGQRVLAALGLLDEALALGVRVDRLFGDTPTGRAVLDMANGSFSRLREGMKVAQHARPFPWGAVWTVLPAPDGFPEVELRQRFRSASQMIGLMPVGKAGHDDAQRGINLFWSLPVTELDGWVARIGLPQLKARMAALFPDVAPLLGGLTEPAQLREARYADVWMARWHDGRVLAIGDCAHGMSPQLGQGANMALIDAHALAAEAGAGGPHDWPAVFARWSGHRRAHLRFYGQASRGLTPMFQSDAVLAPWLRDRFFGWGGRLPYIHQQSIATLAGYKTGWLWGRLKL